MVRILRLLGGSALVAASSGATATPFSAALRPAIVIEGQPARPFTLVDRMQRWKVPGLSIAIIDQCRIVAQHGYGLTHANGVPVQPGTLFQAASVTKPVAALAALRLVQDGRLDLDADVAATLKSWSLPASPFLRDRPVTLRGLLSHSAGLLPGGYGGYARSAALPNLLQTLDGQSPARPKPVTVSYPPGSSWRYSGGGYLVAQQLMTDATGEPFAAIVQRTVLAPVGMRDSGFTDPQVKSSGNIAAGHRADGTMVPGGWHIYPELAAAGLWTNASDLAVFALAVMQAARGAGGAILRPDLARSMTSAHIGPRSLGFVVGGDGDRQRVGHDGTNEGYNSALLFYPQRCQGAVVLTNSDNAKPLIAELLRGIADQYGWADGMESVKVGARAVDERLIARFVGRYQFDELPNVAPFSITHDGKNGFVFDRGDGHREPLYATEKGLAGPDSGIFLTAIDDEAVGYERIGGKGAARAGRVTVAP